MARKKLRLLIGSAFGVGALSLMFVSVGRPEPKSLGQGEPGLPPKARQQDPRSGGIEQVKKLFPKVDYDAPEPTDPIEKAKRHNRSKHFDNGRISKTPTHYSFGLNNHWDFGLAALPITQDSAVVVGRTLSRGAFISNDKTGIYTELSVKIEQVLKGSSATVSEGANIDISRIGGVVRYSTGEESLFFIDGQNMPTVGKRYLFFLKSLPDSEDFTIVTAYELTTSGVRALDSPDQFRQFDGTDEATFLMTVRNAIAQQRQ